MWKALPGKYETYLWNKNDRFVSMGNEIFRLLIFSAITAVLFFKHREVAEAIERFMNNFPRGGPPTAFLSCR